MYENPVVQDNLEILRKYNYGQQCWGENTAFLKEKHVILNKKKLMIIMVIQMFSIVLM